jgi:phosphoenolpyruvate synthase/pyruvate phosphate dikinase
MIARGTVKIVVPSCRTVDEGRRVQAELEKHGLRRGEDGLEVYVMCEIPSNVLFAEVFDGFSIDPNDLTQLILGVDCGSEIVAPIFDERNAQ